MIQIKIFRNSTRSTKSTSLYKTEKTWNILKGKCILLPLNFNIFKKLYKKTTTTTTHTAFCTLCFCFYSAMCNFLLLSFMNKIKKKTTWKSKVQWSWCKASDRATSQGRCECRLILATLSSGFYICVLCVWCSLNAM